MPTGDVTFNDIVEKTKAMLGENYRGDEIPEPDVPDTPDEPVDPTNPVETNTKSGATEQPKTILETVCEMVISEAAQWTNQSIKRDLTRVLNDCWPVIVKCSCLAYLNRGAEGLGSQSELGQQNVYNDWVKLMHQQLTNRRHIL